MVTPVPAKSDAKSFVERFRGCSSSPPCREARSAPSSRSGDVAMAILSSPNPPRAARRAFLSAFTSESILPLASSSDPKPDDDGGRESTSADASGSAGSEAPKPPSAASRASLSADKVSCGTEVSAGLSSPKPPSAAIRASLSVAGATSGSSSPPLAGDVSSNPPSAASKASLSVDEVSCGAEVSAGVSSPKLPSAARSESLSVAVGASVGSSMGSSPASELCPSKPPSAANSASLSEPGCSWTDSPGTPSLNPPRDAKR
mmetsp:Transcript_33442/g.93881  ORF Transcript_33442/g.93881 Transcript_33442/m.93881 type:complete len:260 (+) Transcript_33442:321-1100(+)